MGIAKTASVAKQTSVHLTGIKSEVKNKSLSAIAKALKDNSARILSANQQDLA